MSDMGRVIVARVAQSRSNVFLPSPFALDERTENWLWIKFGWQIGENLKNQKLRI